MTQSYETNVRPNHRSRCLSDHVSRAAQAIRLGQPFLFLKQHSKNRENDMATKENFGVIWTDEIQIEELEAKIAPSGSLVCD